MNAKYQIILYWSSEDSAFIAEVPELPGCMADGQTRAEALQQAELVINEWIETAKSMGREIPIPRGKLMYAWERWMNIKYFEDTDTALVTFSGSNVVETKEINENMYAI